MCGRDIQCSLARRRREETRTEKELKMRLKELEAEIEKFKYVLGVLRLAFVDFNISGYLRRMRKWRKGNNISVMKNLLLHQAPVIKYEVFSSFKIFILNPILSWLFLPLLFDIKNFSVGSQSDHSDKNIVSQILNTLLYRKIFGH